MCDSAVPTLEAPAAGVPVWSRRWSLLVSGSPQAWLVERPAGYAVPQSEEEIEPH